MEVDDYGNDKNTTDQIILGEEITGEIEVSGDEDWFRVDLTAGITYLFEMNGAGSGGGTFGLSGEPMLLIRNPSGNAQKSTKTGGIGDDPLLSYVPPVSGTYFLVVEDWGGVATGTYNVSASISPFTDDYANTKDTSAEVQIGGDISGNLEVVGDEDWLKVTLQAGVTYTFELLGADGGGGTLGEEGQPRLRFYNTFGNLTRTATAGGEGGDPLIAYVPSAAGTYYLSVDDLDDIATGTYTLSASAGVVVDDYAGHHFTTDSVPIGGQITGNIEKVGDQDWFKVELVAGTTYLFELHGANSGGGSLGAGGEISLVLYGIDAITRLSESIGGASGDPHAWFIPNTSGTYFLAAQGLFNAGTGTYTLEATTSSLPDDFSSDASTTGALTIGGQAAGELEIAGDVDWFKVSLVKGKSYAFELLDGELDGQGLPALTLYTPDGSAGDPVTSGGPLMQFVAPTSGTYHLAVNTLYGNQSGTYTLVSANEDDFASDITTTGQVSVGSQVLGNIEIRDDRDWYKVSLLAGTGYRFEVLTADSGGGTLDTGDYPAHLNLYGPTGIFQSTFVDRNFFIPDQTGVFYVAAGALGSETGTYTLRISHVDDDYPGGDSTTGELPIGGLIAGEIEVAGDDDWIRVNLASGVPYRFELVGEEGGGGSLALEDAVDFQIYNALGNKEWSAYVDSNVTIFRVLNFVPENSGVYYLSVSSFQSRELSIGTYSLNASITMDDYSGDLTTQTELPIGNEIDGNLEIRDDEDWFKVNLTAGTQYLFEMLGANGGGGNLYRPSLTLYDAGGQALHSSFRGGKNGDALISYTAEKSGIFYVAADSVFGSTLGTYTLTATTDEGDVNNLPTGSVLLNGDARPGEILLAATGSIQDNDGLGILSYQWYRNAAPIAGATGESYTVEMPDVGNGISARVSYIDGKDNSESVLSDAITVLANLSANTIDLIEMYITITGRAPDAGGLDFWSGIINSGTTLASVADQMWETADSKATYPRTMPTDQVVTAVYTNVLDRQPDIEGLNFWIGRWNAQGAVPTMLEMIDAMNNYNGTDPVAIVDQQLFLDKVDVGGFLALTRDSDDLDLARSAYNYLADGNSVQDTLRFIDVELGLIGQASIPAGNDSML